jgi:hypothetical protein
VELFICRGDERWSGGISLALRQSCLQAATPIQAAAAGKPDGYNGLASMR